MLVKDLIEDAETGDRTKEHLFSTTGNKNIVWHHGNSPARRVGITSSLRDAMMYGMGSHVIEYDPVAASGEVLATPINYAEMFKEVYTDRIVASISGITNE